MSRQVYLLGWGLALVAGAFLLTDWALLPAPGVTEANARRIRLGMTLKEVEAITGRPAAGQLHRDGLTGPVVYGEWDGDGESFEIAVEFGEGERVRHIIWGVPDGEVGAGRTSLFARLRDWLGW